MIISPSILAANKQHLIEDIQLVESLGVEFIHFDVMDGKFVPNTSYTIKDLDYIAPHHHLINDVHIMVENPYEVGIEFANHGADYVTFHIEATKDETEVLKIINKLHQLKVKVGISIKPNTSVETILKYLPLIDLILVMSVEPGFGGQKFIESAIDKIKTLRQYIDQNNLSCLIEVDGGINNITGQKCKDAGVDILVAGSYLFGHDDIKERIDSLR